MAAALRVEVSDTHLFEIDDRLRQPVLVDPVREEVRHLSGSFFSPERPELKHGLAAGTELTAEVAAKKARAEEFYST